jgi:hypothetical protein
MLEFYEQGRLPGGRKGNQEKGNEQYVDEEEEAVKYFGLEGVKLEDDDEDGEIP